MVMQLSRCRLVLIEFGPLNYRYFCFSKNTLGTDVGHDVLDPRVVLEAVHGQVLAVAGALEAAVRHLGDERDVGIDPDHSEIQPPGDAHRASVIPRPDAGAEAVGDVVGPADGLILVGEL